MNLIANDLKNLGDELSDLAQAAVDWGGKQPLDTSQQRQLDELVENLIRTSDALGTAALAVALSNIQASAADLQNGIKKAQHALTVIGDIGKVFSILGAAVGLGGAVLAPVPTAAGIAGALNGLVKSIQTSLAAPSTTGGGSTASSGR